MKNKSSVLTTFFEFQLGGYSRPRPSMRSNWHVLRSGLRIDAGRLAQYPAGVGEI